MTSTDICDSLFAKIYVHEQMSLEWATIVGNRFSSENVSRNEQKAGRRKGNGVQGRQLAYNL